ncbi:alpha/beta hydrolase [Halalkalibacillus sediminis]|uniref:Alpha/beta hydrolase n=1 Tax=Halalkalibacillus sediminis TaxID=2018042 RepID=A0A2I0QTF1_9BACI|nr:alpha/beta fold hydrolase [Halalkalibacillus sediminis]PKR77606.1 alpha/beta hydrolase [Halalkalibacillus sediminis]
MYTTRMIETSRGVFEVFVKGEGEPLCATHLYSQFNEKGNYFADTFTEEFKVYLVNLRGAGNSSPVIEDDEMSMESAVKDMESIRETLGIDRWAFAGHSTGGMLGLVYALQAGESLTKLFCSGASADMNYAKHPDSIYCAENPNNERMRGILALFRSEDTTREERIAAGREWGAMSLYRPEKADEYYAKPSSGAVISERVDYFSYVDGPEYDVVEDLKNISTPTLVASGRHDAQCPLDCSIQIADGIPEAKLEIFEESNHNAFVEEKDKFKRVVSQFKEM